MRLTKAKWILKVSRTSLGNGVRRGSSIGNIVCRETKGVKGRVVGVVGRGFVKNEN